MKPQSPMHPMVSIPCTLACGMMAGITLSDGAWVFGALFVTLTLLALGLTLIDYSTVVENPLDNDQKV